MPLVKRAVEPVHISRTQLDSKIKNELDGVVINTLAGVIKQISSLSKHAENLFGDLFNEANNIFERSTVLNKKVGELHDRIRQLDATVKKEVKVEEIISMAHFKSGKQEDQQILHRQTMPTSVADTYQHCNRPPALNEFTSYRDDDKEGLKFYTDPSYFYRLWLEAQNSLLEKRKKRERKKRRRNKDNQPKKEIKAATKKKYLGTDVEFRDEVAAESNSKANLVRVSRSGTNEFQQSEKFSGPSYEQRQSQPQTINYSAANGYSPQQPQVEKPLEPPPPPPPTYNDIVPQTMAKPVGPPPPPPPSAPPNASPGLPTQHQHHHPGMPLAQPPQPPPPTYLGIQETHPSPQPVRIAPAPPPPPPPPANIPAPPPPPPGAPVVGGEGMAPPPPKPDPRNDLLSAIRLGKQLRKVEQQTQSDKKTQQYGNDVASILARRIALQDSDSESGSEGTDSDEEWSD